MGGNVALQSHTVEAVALAFGAEGEPAEPVTRDNPLPMTPMGADGQAGSPLPSGTNRSGTITTGGTAQQLAAANAARRFLRGQNISAGDMWLRESANGDAAAPDAAGSFKVGSGQTFEASTSGVVSIWSATTGAKFTALEG